MTGPNGVQVIKVMIIEDSDEDAELLKSHLVRFADEHDGLGFSIGRVASALEYSSDKHHADLIFLDIGLPGIDGMEIARLIRAYDAETPIIFTTSLAQYAVSAWEVEALDFIVKPVRYRDLAMRMDRAMRVLRRTKGRVLYLSRRDNAYVLPISDIVAVEVRNHTLTYHLAGREPVSVRGTLSEALEKLAGAPFARISNSCLVNMDHIRSIQSMDVEMSTGEVFYLSYPRRSEAIATISDYFGDSV